MFPLLPVFPFALRPPSPLQPSGSGFSPDSVNLPYSSPASSAGGGGSSSASPYPWNPNGKGLIYERFPFPIITVDSQDGQWLRSLALQNAQRGNYQSFPQHAIHFFYFMGPSGLDSYSCLDSGSCLPLGGQSVWASMGPLDAADAPVITPAAAPQRRRELAAAVLLNEEADTDTEVSAHIIVRKSPEVAGAPRQREAVLSARQRGEGERAQEESASVFVHPFPHSNNAAQRANKKKAILSLKKHAAFAGEETRELPPSSKEGRRSLGGSAAERVNNKPQRPIVMAVTAMDSSALFHDLAFGADSTASGIIAVLAAADALSRSSVSVSTLPRQILFGVFQGEQWGRIGSRRWVSEVEGTFRCLSNVTAENSPSGRAFCASPLRTDLGFTSISLDDIVSVVAVDQVGTPGIGSGSTPSFFLHEFDSTPIPPPPSSSGMNTVRNSTSLIFNALSSAVGAAGIPVPVAKASNSDVLPLNIPPTPLLSFQEAILAGNPPGVGFDGAVLAGYDRAFLGKYYHSRFDYGGTLGANATSGLVAVDPKVVTAAATALAKGLFALASLSGNNTSLTPAQAALQVPTDIAANATFVSQLLSCITINARCSLFASALGMDEPSLANLAPDGPLSLYSSVYSQPYSLESGSTTTGFVLQPTPLEAVIRNLLGRFSALPSQTKLLPSPTPAPKAGGQSSGAHAQAPGGNPSNLIGSTCTTKQCQDAFGKAYECLLGACVVANSFYHDALSPALAASTSSYGSYIALTGAGFSSASPSLGTSGNTAGGQPQPPAWVLNLQTDPLWTEPYWSASIGASVFLKDSPQTDAIVLGLGITITLLAIVGSYFLINYLDLHYKVP